MLGAMVISTSLSQWAGINMTPSLPRGVYWRVDVLGHKKIPHHEAVVAFDMSLLWRQFSAIRGYNPFYFPLMKRIVADPTHIVELTHHRLIVRNREGMLLKQYFLHHALHDQLGRSLMPMPLGVYPHQGYWVLGSQHHGSFDSQYFGPIMPHQIVAIYESKPFLSF